MKIYVTRNIPDRGIKMLKEKGWEVVVQPEERVLEPEELISNLKEGKYDAVLCDLDDKITAEVLDVAGRQCKIFANYAVGYDNLDLKAAQERGVMMTNTPGILTNTVAEHAIGLLFAIARRIPEADRYVRAGKYTSWTPTLLLGNDVSKKVLGVVGLGRIGSRVAYHAVNGFEMKVLYYDVKRSEEFEKELNAEYRENVDDIFKEADFISIHVPLLPATRHLVDARRLNLMKRTAYLINTSRGPVIDEKALAEALKSGIIKGAAIDVFENEPE